MAQIWYGAEGRYSNVTALATLFGYREGVLTLPSSDPARAAILGDPLPGIHKKIKITDSEGDKIYPAGEPIVYKGEMGAVESLPSSRKDWWEKEGRLIRNPDERLRNLHRYLRLVHGSMLDEYPEQLMIIQYVRPEARVLEIGGNIGRSSCVIASVLSDSSRLVVLESDPKSAKILEQNRDINGFKFQIQASALSSIPLSQSGWDTLPTKDAPSTWAPVNTITWEELGALYSMKFDTLVLDCEGAFYPIVRDYPQILDGVHTVIIENDFHRLSDYQYVSAKLTGAGLKRVVVRSGGWGPCSPFFYEVYSKCSSCG